MNAPAPTEAIVVDGSSYELTQLTEFGFESPVKLPGSQRHGTGTLVIDDQQIPVEFRVRRFTDGLSSCTFMNFSISDAEKVRRHLKRRSRAVGGLEDHSYDELASGKVGSEPAPVVTVAKTDEAAPQQKGYVKSFAMMAMLLTMVLLAVVAVVFLRSRSTLGVTNAALVGNCIHVNSKVEGEIVDVFVAAGDKVRKGDLLVRLTNPEVLADNKEFNARLETAKHTVVALENQKKLYRSKLKFASQKLALDREVAVNELEAATQARESAKAGVDRMQPFVQRGAVTRLEFDEVQNLYMSEVANVMAKENEVKQIDFGLQAAKQEVIIVDGQIDDQFGKIQTELDIAKAQVKEYQQLCDLSAMRASDLEVVAPRDGTVYVTYRQPGEFIKVADELIGLSYEGTTWAAGHVTASQASRVLPGQPVSITVPAMDERLEGIVMAVGHRAMYSKGNYNAEFRGATATDVPIKVYIEDLPKDIPSGIRLGMTINTGFGVEWLDDTMGYKLQPIGTNRRPIKATPADDSHESPVTLAVLPESKE